MFIPYGSISDRWQYKILMWQVMGHDTPVVDDRHDIPGNPKTI